MFETQHTFIADVFEVNGVTSQRTLRASIPKRHQCRGFAGWPAETFDSCLYTIGRAAPRSNSTKTAWVGSLPIPSAQGSVHAHCRVILPSTRSNSFRIHRDSAVVASACLRLLPKVSFPLRASCVHIAVADPLAGTFHRNTRSFRHSAYPSRIVGNSL